MSVFIFANNANSALASGINSTITTISLTPGTGALFPSPSAGQVFTLSLTDASSEENHEICYCTSRSGDVLTVVRGQEGTTAQAWLAGDIAFNGPTAGSQASATQQGYSTYGVDASGTPNAIAFATNPAITTYSLGLLIQFQVANTNTSACTINAGPSTVALQRSDGQPLQANDLIAGTTWDAISVGVGGPIRLLDRVNSQLVGGGLIGDGQAIDVNAVAIAGDGLEGAGHVIEVLAADASIIVSSAGIRTDGNTGNGYKTIVGPETIPTGNFNADMSIGAYTCLLTPSPNENDSIVLFDYLGLWTFSPLTLQGNGNTIEGSTEPFVCILGGTQIMLRFKAATGWRAS